MDVSVSRSMRWRKASYSSSNGGNCVEVGQSGPRVTVRDSKDPAGPRLAISRQGWQEFTRRVKNAGTDPV